MKVLLTAFQPFAEHRVNPSQLILEALLADPPPELVIIPCLLPVEAYRSIALAMDCLKHHRPDAVVSLGLAASRSALSLEQWACNHDDFPFPDQANLLLRRSPAMPGAPERYPSSLPLELMAGRLRQAGIPVEISQSAGGYVCNHFFFGLQHALQTSGQPCPFGFIHVPCLIEQSPQMGLPLPLMSWGIHLCLQVLRGSLACQAATSWK